ncbi:hemerythrin domain-containing protein [Stenotrophomonas sp.]|uniref:hemerythrin domain-containing protein n=1 Tax=Stenotrophomonas sp. TaxID=69392 RepID=UPI0028B0879F|nr:hemerythrin domain-containing protein [Stenotrophomonas sp.]
MTETLYDALRESHERQRSLCRKLLRSPPHTQRRLELFTELRVELAAHAAAEERFLYAPILMHDAGLDASRHALHEHHEIDEIIADMRVAEKLGAGWMAKARKLSEKVHHHLREEERKFFQISGKILSATRKHRLAAQYRKDFERMRRSLAAE